MTILSVEFLLGSLNELLVQVVAYQIDGAATKAATHDARTCNTAFLSDIVQEVELLARYLIVF